MPGNRKRFNRRLLCHNLIYLVWPSVSDVGESQKIQPDDRSATTMSSSSFIARVVEGRKSGGAAVQRSAFSRPRFALRADPYLLRRYKAPLRSASCLVCGHLLEVLIRSRVGVLRFAQD